MSRKNIFDILARKYNLFEEIQRIEIMVSKESSFLFYGNRYTLESLLNYSKVFRDWDYRDTALDTNDYRTLLNIAHEDMENSQIDLFDALNYLEYIVNIIILFSHSGTLDIGDNREFGFHIFNNVNILLQHLNYEIITIDKENTKYIIVERNPSATTVAEILEDDERSLDVIRYNHHAIKGDLDEKRKILSQLFKEFEKIKTDVKGIVKVNSKTELENDLRRLFNSTDIRHTDTKDVVYKNFMALPPKEQEEWYDRIYDMFLTAMLAKKYVDMKDDLDGIKSNGQEV